MNRTEEWAKIDAASGHVTWVGLAPDAFEMPDGSTVSTPIDTPTDPDLLLEAGYLPVYHAGAEEPPEGHVERGVSHEVRDDRVVRTLTFEPAPPDPVAEVMASINDLHDRLQADSDARLEDRGAVTQALSDAQAILAQIPAAVEAALRDERGKMERANNDLSARVAAMEATVAKLARS